MHNSSSLPSIPVRSRYGFLTWCLISLLLQWTILRIVFLVEFYAGPGNPLADVWNVFWVGFERDAFAGLVLVLPLLLWAALWPERWFAARWHRVLVTLGLVSLGLMQVFLTFAEYYFFDEFRSRFNTVAVDYLLYPHEVFINIWDTYPVSLVVLACAVISVGWTLCILRAFRGMWLKPVDWRTKFLCTVGALTAVALLSTVINLKELRVSQERILNEIANNGVLAFSAAFWTRNLDFAEFYRTMAKEEAYSRSRRLLSEPNSTWVDKGDSIRRQISGDPNRPRLNVVVLLEESLGSEFWGSLGRPGATLTPEMDRLAGEEGMLFTKLYASGNRTVRGFEGVLSSFPPLPGDSIVKRDRSENVETIARVLKRDGYSTVFLYGGRGLFDGMRSFAVNNGYDRFVEQKHFANPTHTTIWGVCDEDLFARAIEECRALAQSGKPFCATVLSVSNHKPFTYPKGRIAENPDERRRANAVKYSDYALGRFFTAARKESFWTNTVFVVVADHGARVYGSQKIPIHSYEIPLLLVGPAVVPSATRCPTLGCSLDVTPTILGLIGRPYQSLFFGHDLLQRGDSVQSRVLINHNRDIGLFTDGRLVVFGLRKTVEFYRGDPKGGELHLASDPTPADLEAEKDAIALFQVADDLYTHRRYRIDGDSGAVTNFANLAATPAPKVP